MSERDLLQIVEDIAERCSDMEVGENWASALVAKTRQLRWFPKSHPEYEVKRYRKLIHGEYLIVYRIFEKSQRVLICRVFHGARSRKSIGRLQ
jgi:plasmid stabilization system protein ParE